MDRPTADPHITDIKPYVPGKQAAEVEEEYGLENVVKLASNENPLGPSPAAREVVEEAAAEMHIYPDGDAPVLREAVADFHDVGTDEVLHGNGSDQLLRLTVQTLARWGEDHGIVSEHSFGAYPIALGAHNMDYDEVRMRDGLVYNLEAMREAVRPETRIVFVANPNNPTGTYVSETGLRDFLEGLPEDVVAIVDEAYHQYARADDFETALELRDAHELLIVTRTFSKCFGLAGLRAGYAIAPPRVIDAMNRVRAPFNCNRLAQKAAAAALEDREFVRRSVELNERGRDQLTTGLAEFEALGVDWTPSQTNFLLVETPHPGPDVYEAMLEQGVIVRPMGGYDLPNHLRITIGTEEQNARCLRALRQALEQLGSASSA